MNLCRKFHPNRTMEKCSKLGEIRERGELKKMQTSQMPSTNVSMQEVSSKSYKGKVFKNMGDSGEREFRKKNANITNAIPQ